MTFSMNYMLRFVAIVAVLCACVPCAWAAEIDEACGFWGCEVNASALVASFVAIVIGSVMVVYFVATYHIKWLPESVAVVVYGILIGIILRFVRTDLASHLSSFDPDLFFLFILPSIIFEAGYSLPKTPFFQNIAAILALALVGTGISYIVVGALLYAAGYFGFSYALSLWESLVLSALLSATDPVATLAIFQALNVEQTLYMIVFGESVLNDAVALILFRATYFYEPGQVLVTIGNFLVVAIGSPLLGVAVALLFSFMLRVVNVVRFPPLETIMMIMFAYLSYVIADAFHLSGILSVFACGIAFNHYGSYSLSPYTTLTSRQLFRTLAFICETCVFIYIGISLSTMEYSGSFDVRLVMWVVLFCLLARAVHVFPIIFVLNKFIKRKISTQTQIAIWFAGLRGAIAFSLALDVEVPNARFMKVATLIFVHATLFGMGCGTLPLLKMLNIKSASEGTLDNITKPRERSEKKPDKKTGLMARLDSQILKPWLRRPKRPLAQEAITLFERLVQTSNEEEMQPPKRALGVRQGLTEADVNYSKLPILTTNLESQDSPDFSSKSSPANQNGAVLLGTQTDEEVAQASLIENEY